MPEDRSTVVVAEDDADIRELLAVALRRAGMLVVTCSDGHATLDACALHRPALVVLDVMMPGLDGLEVCRRLRADRVLSEVPVLMLTARAQESDVAAGIAAGATDYLVKPFSPRDLVVRVRAALVAPTNP